MPTNEDKLPTKLYKVTFTVEAYAFIHAESADKAIEIAYTDDLNNIIGGEETNIANWDSDFEMSAEEVSNAD